MTDPLADAARRLAELHGEDPDETVARVLRARELRRARAARPFKRCPACEVDLPARAFAEAPERPDGLRSVCRECAAAMDRGRRR